MTGNHTAEGEALQTVYGGGVMSAGADSAIAAAADVTLAR